MASVSSGESQGGFTLNVMPMLDIFSILILFLLMNFSTDPVNHDITRSLELPDSDVMIALDELPSITVSAKEIFVNETKIIDLENGRVPQKNLSQGAIFPLFEELKKLSAAGMRFRGSTSAPPGLALEMDKGHDFGLLKKIMLSAQQADFVEFKLMVSKKI